MTAKEKLESVRMYGRRVSEFLLPDQMKFIEIAMDEYAQQQLKILNIPVVMHHVCPDCEGRKYFPDKESTSGQKPCSRCWGTGQIVS